MKSDDFCQNRIIEGVIWLGEDSLNETYNRPDLIERFELVFNGTSVWSKLTNEDKKQLKYCPYQMQ